MAYFKFLWTDENLEHVAEHGISPDDVENVFCNPSSKGYSRTSGLPAIWGYTEDNRYIMSSSRNWMT